MIRDLLSPSTPTTRFRAGIRRASYASTAILAVATMLGQAIPAAAYDGAQIGSPQIRTSAVNRVPACVTADRLLAFTRSRNTALPAKYADIANHYRDLGDAQRIRWDYAYFQMLLETNFLQFRRGDGSPGDVSAVQNNFAGIGATGNGVPGDRFPDVRTGVLGHLQHLVAYSGETVADPVAQRTRDKQGDIVFLSRKLGRPPTFADLTRRWAVDPAYARNIETLASLYRANYCGAAETVAGSPGNGGRAEGPRFVALAAERATDRDAPLRPASRPAPEAAPCQLFMASFGGDMTRLISSQHGSQRRVTAVTVSRPVAEAQTRAFIDVHANGGEVIGSYDSLDSALAAGDKVCPSR